MIVFGRTVVLERQHLCDHRRIQHTLGIYFSDKGFGNFSLILGGEVNTASILRATVIALAVQGGGIVNDKEYLEQSSGGDDLRVEHQLDHLVVSRCA